MKYKGRPRWIQPAGIVNRNAAPHDSSISSQITGGNDNRETASCSVKQAHPPLDQPIFSSTIYTAYDQEPISSSPTRPSSISSSSASSPITHSHPSDCHAPETNSPSHHGPKTQPPSHPSPLAPSFRELGSEDYLLPHLLYPDIGEEF